MTLVLPPGLTAAQAAIWLDQHLFAGKPIYNTGQFLTIRDKLRLDLFETALRQAVAESPGLRLAPRSGPAPFDLVLLDFRKEKDPLAAADQWMRSEMGKAIPLEDPALFRFAIIRISDDHTLWFQISVSGSVICVQNLASTLPIEQFSADALVCSVENDALYSRLKSPLKSAAS